MIFPENNKQKTLTTKMLAIMCWPIIFAQEVKRAVEEIVLKAEKTKCNGEGQTKECKKTIQNYFKKLEIGL